VTANAARIGRVYETRNHYGVTHGLQLASGSRALAHDYFSNAAARMGWGTNSLTEATEYVLERLTLNYWLMVTLYRNHWISRKIVDVPAKDMVRAWPRVTSDIDPKEVTKIDRAIRRTNTKAKLLDALQWARLFGGAGALIVIDGHENRLDEPLDLDTVELGAYRGLIPFDRWTGITPEAGIASDIRKPLEFNLPEYYRVETPEGNATFKIHASRILRFCGPGVPAPEYQAQSYWGISALEPVFEELRKRDNLSWNVLSLTFRANILGMKNQALAQALSGASMSQTALVQFQSRMQAMNSLLSNQNMMIFDEKGGLESTQYAFSGLEGVMQQFQLDIAGAADMTVTRLFGRTITGLGQANDQDERLYEEKIQHEQDVHMRPQLDRLYPVICMCCAPETQVHTGNGKATAIRSVKIGDSVITSSGTAATVKGVFLSPRQNEVACRLTLWGHWDPLVVTRDHPVLTPGGFVPAEALDAGDYVSRPVRPLTGRLKTVGISRRNNREALRTDEQPLSSAFGWLCGLYISEGSPHRNYRLPDRRIDATVFSIHQAEVDGVVAQLKAATDKGIGVRRSKTSQTAIVDLHDTGLSQWLSQEFGHGAENKTIPDWVFDTPAEFVNGLIRGYLEGDGHIVKTRSNQVSAQSVSQALVLQLRDLLASAGFGWACLYRNDPGLRYGRNCQELWRLFLNGHYATKLRVEMGWPTVATTGDWRSVPRHWRYSESYTHVFIQVRDNSPVHCAEFYDIAVDAVEHDFCTTQCCVHNSELGEVPDDLDLKFPSVRVLDDKEQADLAKTISDNALNLVNGGIFTKAQALKEIKQSSDITGFGTNITDEDISKAEKEQDLAGELAGMLGGEGEEDETDLDGTPRGERNPPQRIAGERGHRQRQIAAARDEWEERKHLRDSGGQFAPVGTGAKVGYRAEQESRSRAAVSAGAAKAIQAFAGIPIAIEYPVGVRRTIRNPEGKVVYDRLMKFDYGFIRNTVGRDGDEIDAIVGPDENAENVFIADMIDLGPDVERREDEDKVLLGFEDAAAAEAAFLTMYPPRFLGSMRVAPIEQFRERVLATGFDADFEESEHPRAKSGETAGQFVKKGGGGSGASLKPAPVASVKAYNEANFRPPTQADISRIFSNGKVPGGWKAGSCRINPDPNADVVAIGTMKKSSKLDFKMSKAWVEKNKAFREKNWTKAQLALKIPAASRNVWFASDPKADKQAVYISTTGVPYSKYSAAAEARKAKKKFADTAKLDRSFDRTWAKIQEGIKSRDEKTRNVAQAVALTAMYSARIGGTDTDDRILQADKFIPQARYEITETGNTDWKKLGAPSNKVGTQFRATGPGTGTGKAGLLKDWAEEPTTKVTRPRGLPASLTAAIEQIAEGVNAKGYKMADHATEYAYVKSNFTQTEIESAVSKAVKSKGISADEAEGFLENLEWKTRQWPKWATELNPKELPDFGSSGILTLRAEHIQEENGKTFLRFIGKESKPNSFEIDDPAIVKWLREAKADAENEPEQEGFLFPWTTQSQANRFSQKVGATKTKEFRTRIGTNRAKEIMATMKAPKTQAELEKARKYVGRYVAYWLQNTPPAALKSYIDPVLFRDWEKGIS